MKIVRIAAKTAVILFCAWHSLALVLYTMPAEAQNNLPQFITAQIMPRTNWYLMLTSQWQNWNLFSPDPMRRITRYRIDAKLGGQWHTLGRFEPANAKPWRSSDDYSFVQQLDDGSTHNADLYQRYLLSFCGALGLPEGTLAALIVEYQVLPESPPNGNWAQWRATQMEASWQEWIPAVAPCTAPDDPALIPISRL